MSETPPFTRWVVLAALTLATAVMVAVSLRGNFLFGDSIGQSDEKRWLFGWANVAADVWKAFGLIAITLLWRARHRRAAGLASLAWVMCLLFGINSALGIYVQDRTTLIGTREARHVTLNDTERALGDVEDRLRARKATRSAREVHAAIARVLARPVVIRKRMRGTIADVSENCTKIDWRTKDACQEVATLREEQAAANETEALQARARELRDRVIELRETGGSLAADPIGEFYAWLTGGVVSVRDVGFGFPLFFALLIEVVSAFGPLTIASYAEATRIDRARHGPTQPAGTRFDQPRLAAAGPGEPARTDVLAWLAERAEPVRGDRAIGIEDLHADYEQWCATRRRKSAALTTFELAFDEARELPDIAGKIRKVARRYYGVGLVARTRSMAFG